MQTILVVILILIAVALIGSVLLQRSEGGALGIGGGGGGGGGMFSVRGSANLFTRITAVLAALFMILSLILAVMSGGAQTTRSVMDEEASPAALQPLEEDGDLPVPGAEAPLALPESEPAPPESGSPAVPVPE